MIDYISDVLATIHFVCFMVTTVTGFILLFIHVSNIEEMKKAIGTVIPTNKLTTIFVISLILAIFTPTSLKWNIAHEYIEKNAQLQSEVNEMKYVIQKYNLEKQLQELRNANY